MNVWQALYLWLLRMYPPRFREEFADEMAVVFAQVMQEANGWPRWLGLAREVRGLLASLLIEHGLALRQAGDDLMTNSIAPSPLRPAPGAWKDAAWAGAPHALVALLVVLPLGGIQNGSTYYPTLIFILMGLTALALIWGWRLGWPRWAASWYAYLALAVLFLPQIALLIIPLLTAAWLYWLTRQDPIKGLLVAMPLVLVLWMPVTEFVEPTLRNRLVLGALVLAALVAAAIVRANNVRVGLWLALGASLLTGLLAAYVRIYWHTLPPEHSVPPTVAGLAELFAPQLLAGSTLLIGPLLLRQLGEITKGGGRAGVMGYRLALIGLALNLFGHVGYFWQSDSIVGPGVAWFSALVYAGWALYFGGVLWLAAEARRGQTPLGYGSLALLVLIPSALPAIWMLPTWFGFRIVPAGFSVGLYDLDDIAKYVIYGVGLIWLLAGGGLVTRLSLRPGEAA